ncbi:MAG TPA: hypothetical protein VFQ23_07620, partial [Anaerolineales bacterium]|nr:hypothetical protein [Anaerolineales bacterium]
IYGTEWIRAFLGGSLSALVVGIHLLLFTLVTLKEIALPGIIFVLYLALDLPGILLHTWLFSDPFATLLPTAEAEAIGWRIIWLALVFWFFSGFALTYFIKNDRKAVIVWFLTIVILAGTAKIWS